MATRPNLTVAQQREDNTQRDAIRKVLRGTIDAFTGEQMLVSDAQKALKQAQKGDRGKRESVLVELASQSVDGDWTLEQIDSAMNLAIEDWEKAGNNHTRKTIAQFTQECLRAMHPAARDFVVDDFDEVKEAFADMDQRIAQAQEKRKTDKSVKVPEHVLDRAFSRKYHAVAGSKGSLQARISGVKFEDFFDLASQRQASERNDEKRAQRMLKQMQENLQVMYDTFGHKDLETVIQFLKPLTADMLKQSRDKLVARANAAERIAKRNAANAQKQVQAQKPERVKAPVVLMPANTPADDEGDEGDETEVDEALDTMLV